MVVDLLHDSLLSTCVPEPRGDAVRISCTCTQHLCPVRILAPRAGTEFRRRVQSIGAATAAALRQHPREIACLGLAHVRLCYTIVPAFLASSDVRRCPTQSPLAACLVSFAGSAAALRQHPRKIACLGLAHVRLCYTPAPAFLSHGDDIGFACAIFSCVWPTPCRAPSFITSGSSKLREEVECVEGKSTLGRLISQNLGANF